MNYSTSYVRALCQMAEVRRTRTLPHDRRAACVEHDYARGLIAESGYSFDSKDLLVPLGR